MKESAGGVVTTPAGSSERGVPGVHEVDQRRIIARLDQARIMELMAADDAPGFSERAVRQQPRLAVAEMELAPGEARRMAEETHHGVADARSIFEAPAKHHVPSAFAVHRPGLRKAV